MKNRCLIVDHGSVLLRELEEAVRSRWGACDVRYYADLEGVRPQSYDAVFLGGGHVPIKVNPQMQDELRIWRECERGDIPLMGICQGALIIAHHSGGDIGPHDRRTRESFFLDYRVDAVFAGDPILRGIGHLLAAEYHAWSINAMGSDYDVIMTDSSRRFEGDGQGRVQIARHKRARVYAVQFHPEAKRTIGGVCPNAGVILDNFFEISQE